METVRREKRRGGEYERWRKSEERNAGVRKGRKVAKHCVFPMFCGSGGSKSRLAKAAGADTSGQMRHEKLHEAHLEVKMYKTRQLRATFGRCDVEKVHGVVARKAHFE